MPADQRKFSDRELLDIFGQNLRLLTASEPSISALCQKLQINRAQFNRYLSGTATPRPLILRRICDHYGVDARILLEPLEALRAPGRNFSELIFSLGTEDPQPVSHQTLPDGFYSEWKPSLHHPNAVNHHLFRISTKDDTRVSKVRCRNNVRGKIAGLKHHIHRIDYVGVLFKQHGGFALFDMPVKGHSVLSLTVYRRGFHIYEDIFPGVKLSSISYSMNRSNSCVPCFLERVPPGWQNLMAAARTPYLQKTSEAPEHVGTVLRGIQDSGFTFIDAE